MNCIVSVNWSEKIRLSYGRFYKKSCVLHLKILFLEILNAPGIHFWKGPLFWSIIFLSVVFPQCGNLQWRKQVIVFSVTWTHCKHLLGLGVDCKGLRIGVSPRETNSGVKKYLKYVFYKIFVFMFVDDAHWTPVTGVNNSSHTALMAMLR